MENDSSKCCLCLTIQATNLISIFDTQSCNENIATVLAKHFWFEIKADDKTFVCTICWPKVSEFHLFYTEVFNVHKEYYSARELVKVEIDDDYGGGEISESVQVPRDMELSISRREDSGITNDTQEDHCSDDNSYQIDPEDLSQSNICTSDNDDNEYETKSILESHRGTDQVEVDEANIINIQDYLTMECELCATRCETFKEVRTHYKKIHKMLGYIRCCNRKYSKRTLLVEHIEWHLDPDKYKCDVCNKSFIQKRSLLNHRETHLITEERAFNFKCTKCSKSYIRKCDLANHLTTHDNEKKCLCHDCGKSFHNKTLLQGHKTNIHRGTNKCICDVCAKVFRNKGALGQHHKTVHQNVVSPKVQCNVCGKWLKNKYFLKTHMVGHEESKVGIFCSICGKKSLNRKALNKHVKTLHSDTVYKCHICEKTFKRQISLTEHISTHTGVSLYHCPYCLRTFNSSSNMYSHKKKMHVKEWEEQERLKLSGVL